MGSVSPMLRAKNCSRPRSISSSLRGSWWPIHFFSIMTSSSNPFVQGDDASSAEPEIVLKRPTSSLDLPLIGLAPQLLNKLGALGQSRRAQRVPLRQQPAGRIRHDLPTVGVVAVAHEFFGTTLGAEAQSLVADEFVVRKAVVKLDHVQVHWVNTSGVIDLPGRRLSHAETNHLSHVARIEGLGCVGRHCLFSDAHLAAEAMTSGKFLRA